MNCKGNSKNLDRINNISPQILISLIENNQEESLRIKYLKSLKTLKRKDSKMFNFLENLLISDSNEKIRRIAFSILISINPTKTIDPVIFAINNESGTFLMKLIEFLSSINPFLCKQVLIRKIKVIEKNVPPTFLKSLLLEKLNLNQLKEILFNYQLIQSLDALYFHRHTVPLALDLYGIE